MVEDLIDQAIKGDASQIERLFIDAFTKTLYFYFIRNEVHKVFNSLSSEEKTNLLVNSNQIDIESLLLSSTIYYYGMERENRGYKVPDFIATKMAKSSWIKTVELKEKVTWSFYLFRRIQEANRGNFVFDSRSLDLFQRVLTREIPINAPRDISQDDYILCTELINKYRPDLPIYHQLMSTDSVTKKITLDSMSITPFLNELISTYRRQMVDRMRIEFDKVAEKDSISFSLIYNLFEIYETVLRYRNNSQPDAEERTVILRAIRTTFLKWLDQARPKTRGCPNTSSISLPISLIIETRYSFLSWIASPGVSSFITLLFSYTLAEHSIRFFRKQCA
ncbi:MAG: hypothetical protein FJ025_04945 [Chloroflexi bacterium]|nr:hypothetical protein [Chloroflexota bacterium]